MTEPSVTLIRVLTETEASIIVSELKASGIEAMVSGTIAGSMRTEAPSYVRVLVHSGDLATARETLDRFKAESSKIDWSQVDVGEFEG